MLNSNPTQDHSIKRVFFNVLYLIIIIVIVFILVFNIVFANNKTHNSLRKKVSDNHFVIREYIKENMQKASAKLHYLSQNIQSTIKRNSQYSSIKNILKQFVLANNEFPFAFFVDKNKKIVSSSIANLPNAGKADRRWKPSCTFSQKNHANNPLDVFVSSYSKYIILKKYIQNKNSNIGCFVYCFR